MKLLGSFSLVAPWISAKSLNQKTFSQVLERVSYEDQARQGNLAEHLVQRIRNKRYARSFNYRCNIVCFSVFCE